MFVCQTKNANQPAALPWAPSAVQETQAKLRAFSARLCVVLTMLPLDIESPGPAHCNEVISHKNVGRTIHPSTGRILNYISFMNSKWIIKNRIEQIQILKPYG